MKRVLSTLALAALALAACSQQPKVPAVKDMNDDQKTLYALGNIIARQTSVFSLTPEELAIVQQGMVDGATGKEPAVEMDTFGPKVQQLAMARRTAGAEKNVKAGAEFADKAAQEKGAEKTASGLVFAHIKEGSGASPKAEDMVKVHYRGTLIDGKEFDSSIKRGEPAQFPLNGVIPCWTEGVQKMKVGGKARLVCPAGIAYGEQGNGAIPPNSTLNFEVELLEIVAAAPAPAPAPAKPAKK